MAIRSVWKGSVGFGMVSIPVKLYGAVGEETIRFNSLHKDCNTRIQMPKWCPDCEVKLEQSDIVKGYPLADETHVVLDEADFASLPVKSLKAVEIVEFVDGSSIDPRHYDKPYFMAPDVGGGKAFTLLLRGMEHVGRVAVAKVSMREREHLCIIRPFGDLLLLQTLLWADELREPVPVKLADITEQEMSMAVGLMQALEGEVNLEEYTDEYREAVVALIEAKVRGEVIQVAPAEEVAPTEDVLAGLMASIEAVKAKA